MTFSQNSENEISEILIKLQNDSDSMAEEDILKKIASLDSLYREKKYYQFNIDGILVNIGSKKNSMPLLLMAKKRLLKKLQETQHEVLLYNLGNAYLSIGSLKLNNPLEDSIVNKELRTAREKFNSIPKGFFHAQANTNHANILETLGRNYEAISFYDKALMTNRNFGMALGNKATAILYYYELIEQKNPELLIKTKHLLEEAINAKSTVKHGGKTAFKHFKEIYESVNKFIIHNNIKEPSPRNEMVPESDYLKFCMKKNLFLNYCFNCYQCEKGFKDSFSPKYLDRVSKESEENNYRYSSYSKKIYYSIKTLNQIFEDYATARFTYFKAMSDDFSQLDKITIYASALDYCMNSIKYGFLKASFIRLFNILDKIAHLLFVYYELTMVRKDIYFKDIKTKQFEALILSKKSWDLLALHSLAWDFLPNQILSHLSKTRNFLTHEFIDIKIDMYDFNSRDEYYKEHHLTEEILCNQIDDLFLVVKSALMYFVNALLHEYTKKKNEIGGILNLGIVTQDYIFSDEDS